MNTFFDFEELEATEELYSRNAENSADSDSETEQGLGDLARSGESVCLAEEAASIERTTYEPVFTFGLVCNITCPSGPVENCASRSYVCLECSGTTLREFITPDQFVIGEEAESEQVTGPALQNSADCYATDWSRTVDRGFDVQIFGALSNELIAEVHCASAEMTLWEVKKFLAPSFNTATWRFLSEGQLLEDTEVLSRFISPSGVCTFQVLKDATRDFVARLHSNNPKERISVLREIRNFLDLGLVTTANAKDVTPLLSDSDLWVRMEAANALTNMIAYRSQAALKKGSESGSSSALAD